MSASPADLRKKKRNKDSSSTYLIVSCGKTQNGGRDKQNNCETNAGNLGVQKRKTVHYRRNVPSKDQVKPEETSMNTAAETNENQGETEGNSDENIYSTICKNDTNLTPPKCIHSTPVRSKDCLEEIYLHPVYTTWDGQIEKRKENIKRWKVDREKKKRLLSTSSTTSIRSFSEDSSDDLFENDDTIQAEANMLQKDRRKQAPPPRNSLVSIIRLVLLTVVSVGVVGSFSLTLIFRPEAATVAEHDTKAESRVLSDLESLKKLLALHETQIEILKVQIEKKNDQIAFLAMETANLKDKIEGMVQIQNGMEDQTYANVC
ncbi:uncharacterized protein LOC123532768 [Mercenaria mercenaria]|uniref:uncharacterized protein LOC123532768 n=1 Tax=Mercenaria mercenaria TaxID=6596 RepID=UPI00234F3DB7|nr:uncharacterized protein LOC123532768 [Mercenaria mercenaria]